MVDPSPLQSSIKSAIVPQLISNETAEVVFDSLNKDSTVSVHVVLYIYYLLKETCSNTATTLFSRNIFGRTTS